MLKWIERHAALFLIVGLAGLSYLGLELKSVEGQLAASSHAQLANRVSNVKTWCDSINQGRDYNRNFTNQTLKQSEAQAVTFRKALGGHSRLTHAQAVFLRLFIDSIVRLERSTPSVLTIHPYALADLPCKKLEVQTAHSGKR